MNNYEAIEFYKSFGFVLKETIKNYYRRIEPADCHVFSCSVDAWVEPKGLLD